MHFEHFEIVFWTIPQIFMRNCAEEEPLWISSSQLLPRFLYSCCVLSVCHYFALVGFHIVVHTMSDRKRTSPSMYERSSIFQSSHGSPPFSSSAIFSKDELDEKQRLEKINFEQKMRIYHLEESLKKYQDGEHRYEMSATSAKAEVHDLKLRLEEMQIEVEQRELLMVKASGVINTLKSELDRCKDSMEKQEELEKKVHGLKLSNEELAQEFRSQLNDLEAELHNTRHSLMVKEQEKSQVDDRLVSLVLFHFGHCYSTVCSQSNHLFHTCHIRNKPSWHWLICRIASPTVKWTKDVSRRSG